MVIPQVSNHLLFRMIVPPRETSGPHFVSLSSQSRKKSSTSFKQGSPTTAAHLQKGSDLICLLLDIEEDGEVLTEEELYAQCVLLLGAGHDTTRNLISNGMYTLLRHPEEMAELLENPELIRSALEELLRYESPVQFASRAPKDEMEI